MSELPRYKDISNTDRNISNRTSGTYGGVKPKGQALNNDEGGEQLN